MAGHFFNKAKIYLSQTGQGIFLQKQGMRFHTIWSGSIVLLAAFAAVLSIFERVRYYNPSEPNIAIYTLVLVFLSSLAVIAQSRKRYYAIKDNSPLLCPWEIGVFLIFTATLIFWRLSLIHSFSLWLDEFVQAEAAQDFPLLLGAAQQHQPPLSYWLTNLGISLFGQSELGIRLQAAVCGGLSASLLYLYAKKISGSHIAAATAMLALSFNSWFFRFCIEARAITLGALLAVIVFGSVEELLSDKDAADTSDFLYFTSLFFIFFVSLGFQPLFFSAAIILAVGTVAILSPDKNLRDKFFCLLGSGVASVILFFPIQKFIEQLAPKRLPASWDDFVSQYLHQIDWLPFTQNLYYKYYLIICSITIVCYFLSRRWIPAKRLGMESPVAFFFTPLVAFYFLLLASVTFSLFIKYFFMPYYVILIMVPCCLCLALLIGAIIRRWNNRHVTFLVVATVLITAYECRDPLQLTFKYDPSIPIAREDLRSAYDFIRAHGTRQDYMLTLSFPFGDTWIPFYKNSGYREYIEPHSANFPELSTKGAPLLWLFMRLLDHREPGHIFVVFENLWSDYPLDPRVFPADKNITLHPFFQAVVVQINNPNRNWKKEWFRFLDLLDKNLQPRNSWTFHTLRMQEALILGKKNLLKESENSLVLDKIFTPNVEQWIQFHKDYYDWELQKHPKPSDPPDATQYF